MLFTYFNRAYNGLKLYAPYNVFGENYIYSYNDIFGKYTK